MNTIKFESVLIIGMGLMGSSLSRALNHFKISNNIYGIDTNQKVIDKIQIQGQVEMLPFSEFTGITPEFLYQLNAGYTKWASAPKEESIFYIPYEKYELFKDDKNQFGQSNEINWISHKLKEVIIFGL